MSHTITKPQAQIFYHDIGDYLTREEKLTKITGFKSLAGITKANGWQPITPDTHHDWVGQRDDRFAEFLSLGDKKNASALTVFENYSRGAETGRDAWCYNASRKNLSQNTQRMIGFYNEEVSRFASIHGSKNTKDREKLIDAFVNTDSAKISWTSSLKDDATNLQQHQFEAGKIVTGLYRPYSKQWTYFSGAFTHRIGQMPKIFPNNDSENRVIYLSGSGNGGKDFSALACDVIPDLNMQHSGGQGFPEYIFDASEPIADTGHRTQDTGHRTQDTGHRTQDTGHRTQSYRFRRRARISSCAYRWEARASQS